MQDDPPDETQCYLVKGQRAAEKAAINATVRFVSGRELG
jgi:hypothetical protein